MGIETALAAGGAVLGGLAGSQSSGGGTTTQTRAPWEAQQPFLTYGFDQAKQYTQSALDNPVYQGQRVAGLTPEQQQLIAQGSQFGSNQFDPAQALQGFGMGALTPTGGFGQNASDIYSQYAGVDPTQQIIANAGQYANNPYTQGIIDSASRDVTRNLYENQLPSLALNATGTGNINSTRAGVQQGIAQRGAADRLADISSNIRGQFFNTGLSQAQNQYNQNLQNSLTANQGVQSAFGAGANALGAGQNLATGGFNLGSTAAGMNQTQGQNVINADMQKFAETNNIPLDLLSKYMQLVGGSYGGTSTSTAPETGGGFMGGLQGALGGALGGFGLGSSGAFGGMGGGSSPSTARVPMTSQQQYGQMSYL